MEEVPVRIVRSKTTGPQPTFTFSENKITFHGHIQGNYRQHIKDIVIPNKQQFIFSVKVVNSLSSSIMLGIVIRKRRGERSSYDSGQAIAYSGKGIVWSGPQMK